MPPGFAACFHGALTLVAMKRRIRLPTDLAISASATIQRDPSDGLFEIELDVEVGMPGVDLDDRACAGRGNRSGMSVCEDGERRHPARGARDRGEVRFWRRCQVLE
ncbi:hypothetical protein [Burkholderia arboris]|uniref:hypothetical protein n=1 Tax=Burkholderia arboris TaxID=488730 RepID=UPI0030B85E38